MKDAVMEKFVWVVWVELHEYRGNKEGKWRPKQAATSLALETGEGIQARGCEVVDTGEPFRF